MESKHASSSTFDGKVSGLLAVVKQYVDKMIAVKGMKALVMDEDTMRILGVVYSLSEVISKEVYLTERLDVATEQQSIDSKEHNTDDSVKHLKCVMFLRPTPANFAILERALRQPKYSEYHIFFSNVVRQDQLRSLANADQHCVVREVQEYYADFHAVDPHLFTLNIPSTRALYKTNTYWSDRDNATFERIASGVLAMLLASKRRPVIRYDGGSPLCKLLAERVTKTMQTAGDAFNFNQPSEPLLLIVDRREDPVTPLLSQWTYQAMLHEILGIHDNRVDMRSVPGVSKDLREIVLASHQDKFYKDNMYLNFGDLGTSVKTLVDDYQRQTKTNQKLDSIEDMQRFVENFPEFKQLGGNVSKHVAVMGELSRVVDSKNLMTVSELEQEMACTDDHATHLEEMFKLLEDHKVQFTEKLRLCLIYGLRYEKTRNQLQQLSRILRDRASTEQEHARLDALDELFRYAGADKRTGDLFSNKSVFKKLSKSIKSTLRGVENIYTQHKPLLQATVTQALKGALKVQDFPHCQGGNAKQKYDTIFVFMVGGTTYEEARVVQEMNAENESVNIVLGGTHIHNSSSFIDDILSEKQLRVTIE